MKTQYDIVIVGGGMVGLSLALALAEQTSLSIAILEAQAVASSADLSVYHHRVSAIALSSQRIFQSLGVWQGMVDRRVSPFTRITVWDAATKSEIDFSCDAIGALALGHIIENNIIQASLEEKVQAYPNITRFYGIKLMSYQETDDSVFLTTEDGQHFQASLAVAADGAQSWLRKAVGIALNKQPYQQMGLVTNVTTTLPHEKVARQVFLPAGPLAFLPLALPNLSSIVWSVSPEEASRLLALDEAAFKDELATAFSHRLGDVQTVSPRYAFPLVKQQAEQYIKSRVVLVGDAAHTVHPLAGQGVNIGLLDAASLTDVLVEAIQKHQAFASHRTLRRYERWRRADNLNMLAGVDFIKLMFASDHQWLQTLRSMGLDGINQLSWIKSQLTRHAVGNRAGLPTLAS